MRINQGKCYAFWRAADCRPYGNKGKTGAENAKFLRRKTALRVYGQTNYRAEKICNQSNILSDKPRVRTKSVHGVYILCGTNKNPANGKYIRSQGSFYYNVKMIKRGFLFSLRRGGCCRLCFHFVGTAICRPPKRQNRVLTATCTPLLPHSPRRYILQEFFLKRRRSFR